MMTVKKVFILFIFIAALGMLFPSCYYDKEETLYPFQKCDTTHVTYSQTIVPILSANCYVCHASAIAQGGVVLDSWAGIQVYVTNGKFIPAIDHTGNFPMPKGGSMLPDCTIEKIKRWVTNGAPNN
ncbi:MAG: hypothetical protein D4R97_06950 [Bacteroidetes bacterium]|nr:MAG: hypothetical protein D4R97_06950 [Bacteroidota bacterium]